MKQHSVFYSNKDINLSINKYNEIVDKAEFWAKKSYDELHNMMFSENLLRSWFVLSYGNCPDCNNSVPMYNWIINIKEHPYKVKCPHCSKLFPENDFESYYKSGLDCNGKFSYDIADKKLLGNSKYIDDGNGYIHDDGEVYRFIAYYITMGHWEDNIIAGLSSLSLAFLATKDMKYARRAAILLNSISRFHKDFDYKSQGLMYEKTNWSEGYVCYWAGACNNCRKMVISYDIIFDAIKDDLELQSYLKKSFSQIQQSIEIDLFEDILDNRHKIHSNPPSTDMTILYTKMILNWPNNEEEIIKEIDNIINENTLIDGLPGEKGVMGYASIGPSLLLDMFTQLSLINDKLIYQIFEKHTVLRKTYRFHIDSWYMNKYYPHCGDTGSFNMKSLENASIITRYKDDSMKLIKKSPEWFAYTLYEIYKDTDFLKVIYINNKYSFDGLFENDFYITKESKDLMLSDIKNVIEKEGTDTKQLSINYEQYRMAFLHKGKDQYKRMAFLIYESGANHSHQEALNIGFVFNGKNIISGFGYPPVGHGGWYTNHVKWYRHPSSHNTVVIDNKEHTNMPAEESFLRYPEYGKTLLFEDNDLYSVICAEAKEYVKADKFERLIAMIHIDEKASYIIDIFKTIGGNSHRKFQRSSFENIKINGLKLTDSNYNEYEFMRNFMTKKHVDHPFTVTFHDNETFFDYTNLSNCSSVSLCKSWVELAKMRGYEGEDSELWLPTLMLENEGGNSTFVSVMEVYNSNSNISSITRIDKETNDTIEIRVELKNGKTDLISFDEEYNFNVIRK